MSGETLKPCPWCNSKAVLWKADNHEEWFIGCGGECSVNPGRHFDTREDAIAAWNARATPSSLGDGWVMVPREPTDEMLLKGHHQIDWGRDDQPTNTNDDPLQKLGGVGTTCKEDLRDAYRAMLAAAPSPGGDHG